MVRTRDAEITTGVLRVIAISAFHSLLNTNYVNSTECVTYPRIWRYLELLL